MKAARKHAKAAYEAGEDAEQLSAATRAALAQNYADTVKEDHKLRVKLLREAIDLSPTESDDDRVAAMQRHVLLGETHATKPIFWKKAELAKAKRDVRRGWETAQEWDMVETTFGAEMMVLNGWIAAVEGREEQALEWYDRADALFASPAHRYPSLLQFSNPLLRGDTLMKAGRDIDAALSYQEIMQNLEGELPAEHPYIGTAFSSWMRARAKLEEEGLVAEAEAAGVCKCWPYDEMTANAPAPMVRIPPMMPSNARRSGRVLLKFDVARDGKPENVRAIGYTSKTYVKPAVKSVEKWKYEINPEIADEDLRGITTTVTFILSDPRGNVIPEKEMVMLESAGE